MTSTATRTAAPPTTTAPAARPGAQALSWVLAVGVPAAIASRFVVAMSVTVGQVLSVALAPVWVPTLKRFVGARLLAVVGLACGVSGVWLTAFAQATHPVSRPNLVANTMLLVGIVCGVGALLWSRTVVSERLIGLAYGAGLLVELVLKNDPRTAENPWKFGIAVPLSVLLLSVVNRSGRRAWEVVVLLALAGVSIAFDSRSAFAIYLLSAFLVAAQAVWARPGLRSSVRGRAAAIALVVVASAAVLYAVGSRLLLLGYLGAEAQERSIAQATTSGSIIVGGRPEMAATWALFLHRPWGFGAGTLPTLGDILVAKSGMWSINYQPDNGYVEEYMFGGTIRLHSVVGDLWAQFGIPGIALALLIIGIALRALVVRLASGTASGIAVFATCTMLWNMLFGPIYGTAPLIVLALGLTMLPREGPAWDPDVTQGPRAAGRPVTSAQRDAARRTASTTRSA
ncbi:hypothetical protein Bcav_1002 [Beutenbergia cavernae DSM 12333]|uniref:O-antigen polymerase n=1 Tax=Beutenbergia cavernae (strain ATCC BAA-8 / DSM 12333 / CCUG 43141 / JCM 11478 / NBRC 16432 / NCIMB 13614 / HKI 0122) TaxID=471853 RepID=C5C077_BEUC1|nr:hypothetical protein [Beutenbergia cavernae]ACQ79263.1 hypothetical protein Bcav_1002 [Beutenbergia cavernae DSM 12333]